MSIDVDLSTTIHDFQRHQSLREQKDAIEQAPRVGRPKDVRKRSAQRSDVLPATLHLHDADSRSACMVPSKGDDAA